MKFQFSGRGILPWLLAIVVVILAIGDVATTNKLLATGMFREGNSVMAWLMGCVGEWWGIIKILLTIGIVLWIVGRWCKLALLVMVFAILTYGIIVGRHLLILWGYL